MREMRHVPGGSDDSGADIMTLVINSLKGSVKYQVMHALASSCGFPQHMKALPPPGTLLVTPGVFTGRFSTALSLPMQVSSPFSIGSDCPRYASSAFLVLAHASATPSA